MARKPVDRYADFKALSKDEQRESILSVTEKCIDGAPVYLARWMEIYLTDTYRGDRGARN